MGYAIGVDYGTQSARALLLDLATGQEVHATVAEYPHAVMDTTFLNGSPLPPLWALQHPQDYLFVLQDTVQRLLAQTQVDPKQIVGLGVDFTACTLLPVKADGRALALMDEFKENPYAYAFLWKHHAAQPYADRINALAAQRGEPWLKRYGGKISSEWAMAKMWQTAEEQPAIYQAADYYVEAADWVVWQMTGQLARNACTAGYKELWHATEGFPPQEFFAALSPKIANCLDKLAGPIIPLGSCAGRMQPAMAQALGLPVGLPIAAGNVDAHVTVPAAGINGAGSLLMIMGTSTCHMLCADQERIVPGMCGVVQGGILPGLYGYEAGQSCVGDHFSWAANYCSSQEIAQAAQQKGISVQQELTQRAEKLQPGESGLLALDWWNGNRSVLVDTALSGLLVGMTLSTRPEEIYRALIEATAFGTRVIIDAFESSGLPVAEVVAAGGIVEKNPFLMQTYADVLQRPIVVATSPQAPARGAAMFGAVAAGKAGGGFDDIFAAAKALGMRTQGYQPNPAHKAAYDALYAEYVTLHDYFGRGGNDVMKRLLAMRRTAD